MKKQLMIFIIFVCIFLSSSYSQQMARWKGKIEFEDGVKVIINPKKPLYGEIVLDLEEDLSIGREDDDNYLFFRVRGIAVDNEENIYVNEYGNYRIQKFDKNGNYLLTIGRFGQGPEEFQHLMRLCIEEPSGNVHISDGVRSIKIFDKEGNYVNQIHLEKPVLEFSVDGKGNYFAIFAAEENLKRSRTFCKINSNGKFIANFATFPYGEPFQRTGESSASIGYSFAPDLYMSKITANRYIYGYSENYELMVVNEDGQIQYKIRKEESSQGFSTKEKQRQKSIKQKFNLFMIPQHKPFFHSIFSDSEGRIYVQKNITFGEDLEVNREVDIFSENGYFIYRLIIPRGTYLIKDGFLYDYFMNEDTGAELVRRHKIKNWDQIKEGI